MWWWLIITVRWFHTDKRCTGYVNFYTAEIFLYKLWRPIFLNLLQFLYNKNIQTGVELDHYSAYNLRRNKTVFNPLIAIFAHLKFLSSWPVDAIHKFKGVEICFDKMEATFA